MAAAAATIIQAETPPSTMTENSQNQQPAQRTQVPGPLSDPGKPDLRQHGRHGWWGRRWREPAPPAEGNAPGQLPHAMPEQGAHQTTESTDPQDASSGKRHVSPKFWHYGRGGMDNVQQEGEIPVGELPRGMSGYHGYRYRCFMGRYFNGGPENTYIFREFDFM